MYSLRLASLAKQNKRIFSSRELALLWDLQDTDLKNTTLKRYVQKGVLKRVMRGYYSVIDIDKLNEFEIGCATAGKYSYVTTESVLFREGAISQYIEAITLVGLKNRSYEINGQKYEIRALSRKFLINKEGVELKDNYRIASLERAVADIRHYSPKYHIDIMSNVNQDKLDQIISNVYNR